MSVIITLVREGHHERLDLCRCDNAKLRQLLGELYASIASMQAQLQAQALKPRSFEWEERTKRALAHHEAQAEAIEREQARREQRALKTSFERLFVEAAREHLPPETFRTVQKEANRKKAAAEQKGAHRG